MNAPPVLETEHLQQRYNSIYKPALIAAALRNRSESVGENRPKRSVEPRGCYLPTRRTQILADRSLTGSFCVTFATKSDKKPFRVSHQNPTWHSNLITLKYIYAKIQSLALGKTRH